MTVGSAASIGHQNTHFTRAFHTENQEQGPARNFGIEHSNGKYVYFPDADGLLSPHALQRMLDGIQTNDADLLVFGHIGFDQNDRVHHEKTYPDFVRSTEEIRMDYADYADMVQSLYSSRQETVLAWNPQDTKTRQVIHEEYVDNMIKALELSYSPRHSFSNGRERREWIILQAEISGICDLEIYSSYSLYKKSS